MRKAVSTAYYALFHFLVGEAVSLLIREPTLRDAVARAFSHDEMMRASRAFAARGLPPHVAALGVNVVPPEVQFVAETFVILQDQRHLADYKRDRTFGRDEVLGLIDLVQQAFAQWSTVRREPEAKVCLASLLFWGRWRR